MENKEFKALFGRRLKVFLLQLIGLLDDFSNERTLRIIGDQLMRSGSSIGANYFEAQAASSKKDFINFFHHALKSANETKFWLEVLIESGKANRECSDSLLGEVSEIANILGKSIVTLKSRVPMNAAS